jgi:hypothetical protein
MVASSPGPVPNNTKETSHLLACLRLLLLIGCVLKFQDRVTTQFPAD